MSGELTAEDRVWIERFTRIVLALPPEERAKVARRAIELGQFHVAMLVSADIYAEYLTVRQQQASFQGRN